MPVVLAARFLHIPVIIHESDITPGLANKIASKGANKICVNFPETLKYVGEKGVVTGTPLRQEIFTGSKSTGMNLCKFNSSKPVLLIMGGSSGSVTVNDAVRAAIHDLVKQFNVVHICGKGKIEPSLENLNGYKQFEFVSTDLKHLFAMTDVIVSRAGAVRSVWKIVQGLGWRVGQTHGHTAWCRVMEAVAMETKVGEHALLLC